MVYDDNVYSPRQTEELKPLSVHEDDLASPTMLTRTRGNLGRTFKGGGEGRSDTDLTLCGWPWYGWYGDVQVVIYSGISYI
jgi:hypothetical protein